ncbi:MAG: hypothetical protein KC502_08955 [Myxococcales bacterium]|nr:hypothetical protein [Myxococcales bacterium]
MSQPWQLFVDESGDFTKPEQAVCLGGPLFDREGARAVHRFGAHIRQQLPFLHNPWGKAPLHAAHLRSPLFVALSWQTFGPPALLDHPTIKLSPETREALFSLMKGLTPGTSRGKAATLELRALTETEVGYNRAVLIRVTTLLGSASNNVMLRLFRQLGWPSHIPFAMRWLARADPRRLDAVVGTLRAGKRPDLQKLRRLERRLKRHRPELHRSLESGKAACVAFVRRAVRVAGASPGELSCCIAAEPASDHLWEGRHETLLRAAMRRSVRVSQLSSNNAERGLDVCAASVSIPTGDGSWRDGHSSWDVAQWLTEEANALSVKDAGTGRVCAYESPDDQALVLADWAVSTARRALSCRLSLEQAELAVQELVGLPATLGPEALPTLTAAYGPSQWLEESTSTTTSPPLIPMTDRPWTWEQAHRWAVHVGRSSAGGSDE